MQKRTVFYIVDTDSRRFVYCDTDQAVINVLLIGASAYLIRTKTAIVLADKTGDMIMFCAEIDRFFS
jgi:hypothetical protein